MKPESSESHQKEDNPLIIENRLNRFFKDHYQKLFFGIALCLSFSSCRYYYNLYRLAKGLPRQKPFKDRLNSKIFGNSLGARSSSRHMRSLRQYSQYEMNLRMSLGLFAFGYSISIFSHAFYLYFIQKFKNNNQCQKSKEERSSIESENKKNDA